MPITSLVIIIIDTTFSIVIIMSMPITSVSASDRLEEVWSFNQNAWSHGS